MPSSSFAAAARAADVDTLLQLPFPPLQPLIGCEAGSFAQDTITTRLPAIMDTVLADLALQVCCRFCKLIAHNCGEKRRGQGGAGGGGEGGTPCWQTCRCVAADLS